MRSPHAATKSSPGLPQLEKAHSNKDPMQPKKKKKKNQAHRYREQIGGWQRLGVGTWEKWVKGHQKVKKKKM